MTTKIETVEGEMTDLEYLDQRVRDYKAQTEDTRALAPGTISLPYDPRAIQQTERQRRVMENRTLHIALAKQTRRRLGVMGLAAHEQWGLRTALARQLSAALGFNRVYNDLRAKGL